MRRRFVVEPETRSEVVTGYEFDEGSLTTRSVRRWPQDKLHIMLMGASPAATCASCADSTITSAKGCRANRLRGDCSGRTATARPQRPLPATGITRIMGECGAVV